MKLNKKVEIGINAIEALKKRETFVRTKDIAVEVGTTVNFLEQIMRNLRTDGLVLVRRGPGGGYMLNKEAQVTALDVANAVGRNLGLDLDQATTVSSVNELRKNILEAFANTKL